MADGVSTLPRDVRGAAHGGSVAYLLARLAAVCGDHAGADRMIEAAVERDERAGAPAYALRDLRDHERFLRAAGRHAHADEVLGRAGERTLSLEQ